MGRFCSMPQIFARTGDFFIPVIFSVVVAVAYALWLPITLARVPQPIFLHYSAELGVDALGTPRQSLYLPLFLFIVTVVNALVGNSLMRHAEQKTAALIMVWMLVPFALCVAWFGILMLRVNGVY